MVEVSEGTIEQLESIAKKEEAEFDEVKEEFKENYEEVQQKSEDYSEEKIEQLAIRFTRTTTFAGNRVPTDDIEMLTIGGDVRNTSNGDMFFGTAVVDENPNDDTPAKLGSVRIFDNDLAVEIYDAFDHVGNVVSGNFAVSDGELNGHVEVSDSDDTDFEVHRPDDRSSLVDEIRNLVPQTSIATIADDLTAQTRDDETGDVYPVSSDIYRIEADVYDGYKNPDTGTGIYTLRDDTVFDDEDVIDSPVFNQEEAGENATPGLTCFFDPNKMEWGTGSVVEFFGTVSKNEDDGTINFSADGAVAIFEDGDGFDGYTDSEEESVPEQNTESSNVDRTEI